VAENGNEPCIGEFLSEVERYNWSKEEKGEGEKEEKEEKKKRMRRRRRSSRRGRGLACRDQDRRRRREKESKSSPPARFTTTPWFSCGTYGKDSTAQTERETERERDRERDKERETERHRETQRELHVLHLQRQRRVYLLSLVLVQQRLDREKRGKERHRERHREKESFSLMHFTCSAKVGSVSTPWISCDNDNTEG
jgi:hypothetical protein